MKKQFSYMLYNEIVRFLSENNGEYNSANTTFIFTVCKKRTSYEFSGKTSCPKGLIKK